MEKVNDLQPDDLSDDALVERLLTEVLEFRINQIDTALAYDISVESVSGFKAGQERSRNTVLRKYPRASA